MTLDDLIVHGAGCQEGDGDRVANPTKVSGAGGAVEAGKGVKLRLT